MGGTSLVQEASATTPATQKQVVNHQQEQQRKALLDGLLERCCNVDVLKPTTWSNVKSIEGTCALVTCTNLSLTATATKILQQQKNQKGDEPPSWLDCLLELASKLLMPGGYLVVWDVYEKKDGGGYGDIEAMMKTIKTKNLPLALATYSYPTVPSGKTEPMVMMAWKKEDKGL